MKSLLWRVYFFEGVYYIFFVCGIHWLGPWLIFFRSFLNSLRKFIWFYGGVSPPEENFFSWGPLGTATLLRFFVLVLELCPSESKGILMFYVYWYVLALCNGSVGRNCFDDAGCWKMCHCLRDLCLPARNSTIFLEANITEAWQRIEGVTLILTKHD